MIGLDFKTQYALTLTVASPTFIGSGNSYGKKEYIFNPNTNRISMIHPAKFADLIVQHNLLDEYETFALSPNPRETLFQFLRTYGLDKDAKTIALYTCDAAGCLDESHSLKEVFSFMRDSQYRPYIPGSSLKGALRTSILVKEILADNAQKAKAVLDNFDIKPNQKWNAIEQAYLHTLHLTARQDNAVNSQLRTLSISDSNPLKDDALAVFPKIDVSTNGNAKSINVVRECLQENTTAIFALSLEAGGVSIQELQEAVSVSAEFYRDTYLRHFAIGEGVDFYAGDFLMLGGGNGFFAKNIVYAALGHTKGLQQVANQMERTFRNHRHDKDFLQHHISPHILKYTQDSQGFTPMGVTYLSWE